MNKSLNNKNLNDNYNNVISARKFCYTFRFIDDSITISNENFEKNVQNIYPTELKLKKENQLNQNAKFLDLNNKIQNSPH